MSRPDAAGGPQRRRLEQMTTADLAPLERLFHAQYPEQLIDVATVLYVELLNQAHPAEQAAPLALALTEAVREELGGRSMYVNKGRAFEASRRDLEIYEAYDGRNAHVVGRRYDLCEERIRQIVRKVHAARLAQLQAVPPLDA